ERPQVLVVCEVLVGARPLRDRRHDAADQLPDAALALGRADLAAEILGDDNVGGLLRPRLRDLDVALFEDHFAALAADDGGAQLPLDLVERIDGGVAEEPGERQTWRRRRLRFRARRFNCRSWWNVERPGPALDRLTSAGSLDGAFFHRRSSDRT